MHKYLQFIYGTHSWHANTKWVIYPCTWFAFLYLYLVHVCDTCPRKNWESSVQTWLHVLHRTWMLKDTHKIVFWRPCPSKEKWNTSQKDILPTKNSGHDVHLMDRCVSSTQRTQKTTLQQLPCWIKKKSLRTENVDVSKMWTAEGDVNSNPNIKNET
jgi:hypothetical protein